MVLIYLDAGSVRSLQKIVRQAFDDVMVFSIFILAIREESYDYIDFI